MPEMSYKQLRDDEELADGNYADKAGLDRVHSSEAQPALHHHHATGPDLEPGPRLGGRRFFKTSKSLHTGISVAAGTVMMLFGYEQGVFGGIIVGDDFLEYFNQPSPGIQGFVTSVYDLGCFAGALLTLFVGEKLGRKKMLIIFTIIMTAGIIFQTVATEMNHLIWGRLIAGIGNGGNTATAPVWHVETSHSSAKGMAVVKEMSVNVLGFVISNFVTLAFSGLMTDAQWRFPLGIQLIFCAIILVMVPLLPESPRWLLARKRDKAAKVVLQQLDDSNVDTEFEQIRASVKAEQTGQTSWGQLFKGGLVTRRVLLGMMLQSAQQIGGVNVLAYYLPVVLHRSVGLPQLTARFVAAANSISFFLATTGSIFVVDRFGRRPLLKIGASCMSLAFFGITIGVGVGLAHPDVQGPGIVATVFIFLFFIAFASGWLAVPWLYPAEVNSLKFRTKGAALATACDWLFNYTVVQATPPGIHHLKWCFYLIFALLNLCFVPLVHYFVVETRGKSLEETDRWFADNPGWFVHKADHSSSGVIPGGVGGGHVGGMGIAEDHEAMMRAFEGDTLSERGSVDGLDDVYSPVSPVSPSVARRASWGSR